VTNKHTRTKRKQTKNAQKTKSKTNKMLGLV